MRNKFNVKVSQWILINERNLKFYLKLRCTLNTVARGKARTIKKAKMLKALKFLLSVRRHVRNFKKVHLELK